MNDEEAIRRGHDARKALEVLEPVFDEMIQSTVNKMLQSEVPDEVLRLQAYAKAIATARKTLRSHVTNGEATEKLAAKR